MKNTFNELDEKLESMNEEIIKMTSGFFSILPSIPVGLYPTIPQSLWNYWGMPKPFQREQCRASLIQGRLGWFVCQSSHGTQQIKLYQPWIYKNDVNTPLRIRMRRIMQLASQEPKEIRKYKIRELYRTMPYQLLKSEPVKLRMKNFYFSRKAAAGDMIKVYRAVDPAYIDPEHDLLYEEKGYKEKAVISFEFDSRAEEYYYAVNTRNNELSNLLHFIWQDEIEFETKGVKKPNKWAELAELINRERVNVWLDYVYENNQKLTAAKKRKIRLRRRRFIFYREIQKMAEKTDIVRANSRYLQRE